MKFDETNLKKGMKIVCLAFDRVTKQAHRYEDWISLVVADGVYIGQPTVGDDTNTEQHNPNHRPRFVPFEDVMEVTWGG